MDTTSWTIRDAQINARGAKYCLIEDLKPKSNDNKIRFSIGTKENPTSTPFGAGTYNGEEAKRKTIEFTLSQEDEETLQCIYEWTVPYLAKHSERLFRKNLSPEQVVDTLKHPIIKKGDYRSQIRCKLDTSGSNSVRCWSTTGQRVALPEDLRGYKLLPRIVLSHMWCMTKECGFVFLVTDLQLLESEQEVCPFL